MRNTFTFALWSKTRQARMIDWAVGLRLCVRFWRDDFIFFAGKAARFGFAFP